MGTFGCIGHLKFVFAGHAKVTEEAHNHRKEGSLDFGLLVYIEVICATQIYVQAAKVIQLLSLIHREKSPHNIVMTAEETSFSPLASIPQI